ncbi:MAG: DUF721 domain-containing protein [bacterium]
MNQGIAQSHDTATKSNDVNTAHPADSSDVSAAGHSAGLSAGISSTAPAEDASIGAPATIYNILCTLPLLHNQGFMEAVKARLQKKALVKNWIKIVGPKLAEHTAPCMQEQKLIVIVNEPGWMAALQQIEGILKRKVNEFLKSDQPVDIELRLGKIPSFTRPYPYLSSAVKKKPEITSDQAARIEHLLYPVKNNEKLKKTLKNVLIRHCCHDQNFLEKS